MTINEFNIYLQTLPYIEDQIVYLRYKYDWEDEWEYSNEILEVDMNVDGYYCWLNDWDEGQQDVEILGCIAISDIDVPIFVSDGYEREISQTKGELPKARDAVKPNKVNRYTDFDGEGNPFTPETYDCGSCGKELPWKANYCPECGRKVKWDG